MRAEKVSDVRLFSGCSQPVPGLSRLPSSQAKHRASTPFSSSFVILQNKKIELLRKLVRRASETTSKPIVKTAQGGHTSVVVIGKRFCRRPAHVALQAAEPQNR